MRPSLLEAGERTLLYYWDKSGREAGIHARWLDADGRTRGASVLVGAGSRELLAVGRPRARRLLRRVADDRDRDGNDLWLRHLNSDLQPMAPRDPGDRLLGRLEAPAAAAGPRPVDALASNAIYVTYKIERGARTSSC